MCVCDEELATVTGRGCQPLRTELETPEQHLDCCERGPTGDEVKGSLQHSFKQTPQQTGFLAIPSYSARHARACTMSRRASTQFPLICHISQNPRNAIIINIQQPIIHFAQNNLRIQCTLYASDAGAIQFQVLK